MGWLAGHGSITFDLHLWHAYRFSVWLADVALAVVAKIAIIGTTTTNVGLAYRIVRRLALLPAGWLGNSDPQGNVSINVDSLPALAASTGQWLAFQFGADFSVIVVAAFLVAQPQFLVIGQRSCFSFCISVALPTAEFAKTAYRYFERLENVAVAFFKVSVDFQHADASVRIADL